MAPEENFPPTPKLTLTQLLTLARRQFSSGAIVWLHPEPRTYSNLDENPNPNRGTIFLGGQLSGYPPEVLSEKKLFLKISQNSQETTACARGFFLIKFPASGVFLNLPESFLSLNLPENNVVANEKIFHFLWSFSILSNYFVTIIEWTFRSNRSKVFCKKDVLRNFAKFTGKHLSVPLNFAELLRTLFLQNTSGRLLLAGNELRDAIFSLIYCEYHNFPITNQKQYSNHVTYIDLWKYILIKCLKICPI